MSKGTPGSRGRLGLRAGEWVVVRSREEILATLDEHARLENLPFQPEMLAFCGRRLRVAKVAHKTCDPIYKTWGRRMEGAVHLEGVRCDGGSHGGCQADCLIFWKEAWLRRADAAGEAGTITPPSTRCTLDVVEREARAAGSKLTDDPVWACQATALHDATTLLHWWDVRQYVRDVTTGNHSAWHMVRILAAAGYRHFLDIGPGYRAKIALYNWFQRLTGGRPLTVIPAGVRAGERTPTEELDLQPGEWVQVRSPEEIGATLDADGKNRGMRYDREMLRYSGEVHRVQMRVERLINERTGRMLMMKNPCIQLEQVVCRAECSDRRLGCPRALNHYWREIWLRRTDPPAAPR